MLRCGAATACSRDAALNRPAQACTGHAPRRKVLGCAARAVGSSLGAPKRPCLPAVCTPACPPTLTRLPEFPCSPDVPARRCKQLGEVLPDWLPSKWLRVFSQQWEGDVTIVLPHTFLQLYKAVVNPSNKGG